MKISRMNLLFIATLLFLAIPLVFSGNVSAATYLSDGARHDATTTGWLLPSDLGSCPADTTKTSRPECNTVKFPTYTTQANCGSAGGGAYTQREWRSVCFDGSGNVISLKDEDRNALTCNAAGGTSYAAACVGKWSFTGTYTGNDQCLRCHNSTVQYNSYASRWKETYLKTGHKNMLRKVTAGQPWGGPDGVVYDVHSAGSGTTIDWTNATITTTSLTPPTRTLYYIYGDWMAAAPSAVYDNSATGNGTSAKYTCASCHTTGYVATNFVAGMEPNNTYPGITAGITGSWNQNGIQCARCHNSSASNSDTDAYRAGLNWGSALTFSTHNSTASGAQINSLCIECHNSTQTQTDPAGQLKTAATGNGFSGHILGNEFLNSPHAKFTGTSGQVGTAANYASHFKGGTCKIIKTGVTSTSGQTVEAMSAEECAALVTEFAATSYVWTPETTGNCTTCHDVHNSIVPETGAVEPLRRECQTCHTTVDLSQMKHPATGGTPMDATKYENACAVCHMALESPEGSTHLPTHLFRINTSASYRTFPSATEWSAGTKIAYTSPDGTYTNAVWNDLDLACGQCHGGSAGQSAVKNGAPYMDKTYLAAVAAGMHGAASSGTAAAGISSPAYSGATGMTVTVTDTSAITPSYLGVSSITVSINWGDGSNPSTGVGGGTFTHTYAAAGNYTVTDTASTAAGYSWAYVNAIVPGNAGTVTKYNVSGAVYDSTDTSAPAAGVTVNLKNGTIFKSTTTDANGLYTFSVKAGTYTIVAKTITPAFKYGEIDNLAVAADSSGNNFNRSKFKLHVGSNDDTTKVIVTGSSTYTKWTTSTLVPVDSDGNYYVNFMLPAGTYSVQGKKDGVNCGTASSVTLGTAATTKIAVTCP